MSLLRKLRSTPPLFCAEGRVPPVAKRHANAPPGCEIGPVFHGSLRDHWRFEVFDRLEAAPPPLWQSLFPEGWKDERYFQTLEETFAGEFDQFYLVLRDQRGRARAVQPFFLAEQDVTISLHPLLRVLLKPLRKFLTTRLLMVGCIVGDGRIGVPGLAEVPEICTPLDEALEHFARRESVRIILFKDLPAAYRTVLTTLTQRQGYTRLPSLPAVKLDLDFASFEDYLQNRLGKATRKSLRRKFREADPLADEVKLEVKTSITPKEARVLHALYERVARNGEMDFEVFTPEYFFQLGQRMPDQARYFIWRRGGQAIAFSFCTVHGDTIYDNDLGLEQTCALPLHLYYTSFRDILRWALAQGLKHYQSSPFSYAPKLRLHMDLVPLDIYVRHSSRRINRLLRWFAPLAAPTRREPLLRHFPNADML